MNQQGKKRLLVLTPRLPYPVIGGDRLRIYRVCKALSKKFSLTLLSMCETHEEFALKIPNDGVFDHVERVRQGKSRSYLRTLGVLPTTTPLQIGYYRSTKFQHEVDRLLPSHDGVLSHLIRCAEYAVDADVPKFLEMTDAISLNYSRVRELKASRLGRGLLYSIEAKRLKRYEEDIISRFDLSFLVSQTDKDFISKRNKKANVIVASNGVDLTAYPFKERYHFPPIIAYIGNMTTLQNLDACLYFASEVLPILRRRHNVILRVIGRIDAKGKAALEKFPSVEVVGAVDDINRATQNAWIGVCSVRLAAGVQNKILEYMALGLPVICSGVGLEGLHAIKNRDLLIANSPAEYGVFVERLRADELLYRQLAQNGRKYVENHHDWDSNLEPLVAGIEKFLS